VGKEDAVTGIRLHIPQIGHVERPGGEGHDDEDGEDADRDDGDDDREPEPVVTTYSIVSASPVMNPPDGPIASLANEYAPPVWASAADISPIENRIVKYMTTTMTTAMAIPPNPASDTPSFQPDNSPEITAATRAPTGPRTPHCA